MSCDPFVEPDGNGFIETFGICIQEKNMKSGQCPKCSSTTVFSKLNGMSLGDGSIHVYLSSEWASKPVRGSRHFLCTTCGYFEVYIEDKAKLEAVAKDWQKIGPT
jgi:hypothetical protein